MRKAVAVLFVVFALAFVIGASMPAADAATCYYKCICSQPHYCCVKNGVETCKRVLFSPIQCPQVMDC